MLRSAGFLNKSHTSMDLHSNASDFDADICAPGLEQWNQDLGPVRGIAIAQGAAINLASAIVEQGARAFGEGFHTQDHAAHVRVLNYRYWRFVRRTRTCRLYTVHCIGHRLLRCPLADLDALVAHINPRIVHHREHAGEALVFGAHQLTNAIVIVTVRHDAGGRGVDAKLVLKAHRAAIIVGAERSIGVHMVLRHHEERNPT